MPDLDHGRYIHFCSHIVFPVYIFIFPVNIFVHLDNNLFISANIFFRLPTFLFALPIILVSPTTLLFARQHFCSLCHIFVRPANIFVWLLSLNDETIKNKFKDSLQLGIWKKNTVFSPWEMMRNCSTIFCTSTTFLMCR